MNSNLKRYEHIAKATEYIQDNALSRMSIIVSIVISFLSIFKPWPNRFASPQTCSLVNINPICQLLTAKNMWLNKVETEQLNNYLKKILPRKLI